MPELDFNGMTTQRLYELRQQYYTSLELGGSIFAPDDFRKRIAQINAVLEYRRTLHR